MKEGEIVQVQGGHIIRATGRKDRHSKVFTAKGPRDRRVRLSAHTAIQFYDVQDRLGFDRPSKAVDWLMKKAKSAIDKLEELPPFDPAAGAATEGFEIGQFQSPGNPMGFSGYPNQDLGLSLQNLGNPGSSQGLFPVGFEAGGGSWPPAPESGLADMGHFSRLLGWNGGGGGGLAYGGGGGTPAVRAWEDIPVGIISGGHRIPKDEFRPHQDSTAGFGGLSPEGSVGFFVPAQMHGAAGGREVNLGYHHNSGSSMSTDSSR